MFLNDIGRKELRVIRFMTLRKCVFLVGGCIVELSVAGGDNVGRIIVLTLQRCIVREDAGDQSA